MSEAVSSADSSELPRLGSYQILRPLGSGGMSTVFQAVHQESGSIVALKVLPRKFAQNAVLLQRFLREAKSAENLDHPNIVAIYDRGFDQGRHYLVLEFVEGRDLYDRVRLQGVMTDVAAISLIREVAEGLNYAARLGMIHRDVKPANLLLTPENHAKIIDLGLALQADDEDERVTRDGTTVGTVDYMSPEQARDSRKLNERSDIYSLGCTFFYLLAGSPPYAGGNLADKLARHHSADIPDVRDKNPAISAELARLIQKMMAKKPEHRFANYGELIQALDSIGLISGNGSHAGFADVLIDDDDDDIIELSVAAESPSRSQVTKPILTSGIPVVSMADLAALDAETPSASGKRRVKPSLPLPAPAQSSSFLEAMLDDEAEEGSSVPLKRFNDELPLQTWIGAGIVVGLLIAMLVFGVRFTISYLRPVEVTDSSATPGEAAGAEAREPESSRASNPETAIDTRPAVPRALPTKGLTGRSTSGSGRDATQIEGAARETLVEPVYDSAIVNRLGMRSATPMTFDSTNRILVQRLPGSGAEPRVSTLAAALGRTNEVVELADMGPFHEDDFQIAGKSRLIRGRAGLRPIVKIELTRLALIRDQPAKFLLGSNGIERLVLEGIDLVVDLRDIPTTQSTLFLCEGADLTLRDCTITIANGDDRRNGFSVFQLVAGPRPNVLRLERSLIRGPIQTLVKIDGPGSDVVIDRCVVVGSNGALFDLADLDQGTSTLQLSRSVFLSKGSIFGLNGKSPSPQIRALGTVFGHVESPTTAPWMVVRTPGNSTSPNWLDFDGVGNRWLGWSHVVHRGLINGAATSVREFLQTASGHADPGAQEVTAPLPVTVLSDSNTALSLASEVTDLTPTLNQVATPHPYLLALTVDLFPKLPTLLPTDDVPLVSQSPRNKSLVSLTFDADAPNQPDLGTYLVANVKDPGKRYVVQVNGVGVHAMTPVQLPDGTSLVLNGPAGSSPAQPIPVFYAAKPGVALIELHQGDLACSHLGFSNEGTTRTKHWILLEDALLSLQRCRFRDTAISTETSEPVIVLKSREPLPDQPSLGGTTPAVNRLNVSLKDCWLNTNSEAIRIEAQRGVVRLENCLINAGVVAFRVQPEPGPSGTVQADLILENCTVVAERVGVLFDPLLDQAEFKGRPWMIFSKSSVFPRSWGEGGSLLGVDPPSLTRGIVFWQSSNDLYEVSRFLGPGISGETSAVGSADLKRQWIDLWGINHTRGDRGPDARRLEHVLNFRDKDRSRVSRPTLSQLELDPKLHKSQGVNFKQLPPIPRS